jgi:hypothetical protein
VHADSEEQRSGLRSHIQNITDNGGFFNFNSHNMTSCYNSPPIITAEKEKYKRENENNRACRSTPDL